MMLLLVLAANFSCEDDIKDIPLQYQKCDCDHEAKFYRTYEVNHILLFDAEKVTYNDLPIHTYNGLESISYMICNFTLKEAAITSLNPNSYGLSTICNFPFSEIGDIPKKGIYVSFIGDGYETCNPTMEIPENFYDDIVLTTLKIYTK